LTTQTEPQAQTIQIGPQPGPQTDFLASSADIVIYGGSAGSGKSYALTLEPVRHWDVPGFDAVIFRRSYVEVTAPGGLWDRSQELYTLLEAKPNNQVLSWSFPGGARVRFSHLNHESDKFSWQGSEICMIGFDELIHFSETMFWYMLSRNRSMCGVKPYVRATCNPDPDSWVAKLISWWIDADTGYPIPERGGVIRWFIRRAGELVWADSAAELRRRFPGEQIYPKSLTFIPAKITDNPALLRVNPEYLGNLQALDPVERARLLEGNWKIRPEAGKVINRGWFRIVAPSSVPDRAGDELVRFWDFAATKKTIDKPDPDFTASTLIRHSSQFVIEDCTADQIGPAEVEDLFFDTTMRDVEMARERGLNYAVRWEVEPGSASIRETARLAALLEGLDAAGIPARGEKLVRLRPFAAQARAGRVVLVEGSWNEMWLSHMHSQPGAHDDIADSTAGAMDALLEGLSSSRFLPGPYLWDDCFEVDATEIFFERVECAAAVYSIPGLDRIAIAVVRKHPHNHDSLFLTEWRFVNPVAMGPTVSELLQRHQLLSIAYDPTQLSAVMEPIDLEGRVWCHPVAFSRAENHKLLLDLILSRRLRHTEEGELRTQIVNADREVRGDRLQMVQRPGRPSLDLAYALVGACAEVLELCL
jgi:predicted phage terminase large subunit-like protein